VLRPERAADTDLVIVRELTGGIYFGPRGRDDEKAWDTLVYTRAEIRRVARVALSLAQTRRGRVTSVDKANVLASSRLWREVVAEEASHFEDVWVDHLYVDNAAMQLVADPCQFDVIVTGNLFGDILSDLAAATTGSLGTLPSASVGAGTALYEPVHGSAPDIAGTGVANPMGMILSVAMCVDRTLGEPTLATAIREAVRNTMAHGDVPADLGGETSTMAFASAVRNRL
jgi:3-isopropylmalate dehydrogenase